MVGNPNCSNRVKVHYVAGEDEDNKWISRHSDRLRPPQTSEAFKRNLTSTTHIVGSCPKDFVSSRDKPTNEEYDKGIALKGPREVRRSRILSDDARLAYDSQQQEMKAAIESNPRKRRRVTWVSKQEQFDSKFGTRKSVQKPKIAKSKAAHTVSKSSIDCSIKIKQETVNGETRPARRSEDQCVRDEGGLVSFLTSCLMRPVIHQCLQSSGAE